jgi:hypothetical protein
MLILTPCHRRRGIVFTLLNPLAYTLRAPGEGIANRPEGGSGRDVYDLETINPGRLLTE